MHNSNRSCFNIKGIGTVILGVMARDCEDDQLKILPSGKNILVKSIQMHDDPVNESKSPASDLLSKVLMLTKFLGKTLFP